ncbi:MAG TPA: hypothetical protein VG448_00780 [Solirubrobacterales bacterium]|nr:hypothetical protein [Solirubrobacterales bacterium]
MRSKLVASCVLLVVVASIAAPSLASAANTPLLVENGSAVAVGTKFQAGNVGRLGFTTSLGTMECTLSEWTGEVTKNSTGTVEGKITSARVGGTGALLNGAPAPECTTQAIFGGDTTVTMNPAISGLPWCLRSTSAMALDEFQVRGDSCASVARGIRFTLDITNIGTCEYERTAAMSGTFSTSTTASTFSLSEVAFTKVSTESFLCPASGKLDLTFQLLTDGTSTTLGVTS